MTMLPQPPPDAPAPPPSEEALRSRRWWKGLWVVGILSMLGVAGILIAPQVFRRRCCGCDQRESVSNARQIGLALTEFQYQYGNFPSPATIAPVEKRTGLVLPPGTVTSNDFFLQLFTAGMTQSETMFYAKISGVHKPDNNFTGTRAMEKGECGFTYFLGAKDTDNPNRPLVVTPMIPGTDRFDPKPFEGKAVILKMDCSVSTFPIDKDGHVIVDGRNLMDPHHPICDGHAPSIAWPDL